MTRVFIVSVIALSVPLGHGAKGLKRVASIAVGGGDRGGKGKGAREEGREVWCGDGRGRSDISIFTIYRCRNVSYFNSDVGSNKLPMITILCLLILIVITVFSC